MKIRKRQTAVKGRVSAMLISAAVHIAVLIAAGTFVAVTVVQRQEARFEGRQVSRPKMQLQRLQVPQRARMERQAPQMSQRVTAQAVNTRSIEFQMPEIAGLGGGISVDMSGAGFVGSLGFATPGVNLFGLRSSGEKFMFLLDASNAMLRDELGGIAAYRIIKEELIRLIGSLPPTTLFNVQVFVFAGRGEAFSDELVPANRENLEALKEWLRPLNNHKTQTGLGTLAHPGVELSFEPRFPIPNPQGGWVAGLSWAIRQGVDVVYWLGADDRMSFMHRDLYDLARSGREIPPSGRHEDVGYDFSTYPGGREAYERIVEQARKLHEEENMRRREAGLPDRVFVSDVTPLIVEYLPGTPLPRRLDERNRYHFTSQDVQGYIEVMQRHHRALDRRSIGTRLGRNRMVFNVVQFVPAEGPPRTLPRVADVARSTGGGHVQIRGLREITALSSSND